MTSKQILSASGSSSLKVHSTIEPDFPLLQSIDGAHKIGCHHIVASKDGGKVASVGFGGEVKVWAMNEQDQWVEEGQIVGATLSKVAAFMPTCGVQLLSLLLQMATKLVRFGQLLYHKMGSI